MTKEEFEKVFAETAEKSGVAELARKNQFAENLQVMMIELQGKLCASEQSSEDLEEAANIYANKQGLELKPFARRFFKAGADWQKQRTIDKACEWLKENIYNRVYKCNDGLGFPTAAFLEEFKKAMEEQ